MDIIRTIKDVILITPWLVSLVLFGTVLGVIHLFLLFFSLLLTSNSYASDVYYCSDNALVGFDPKENFKQSNYSGKKFKILIDFENNNVISFESSAFINNFLQVEASSKFFK